MFDDKSRYKNETTYTLTDRRGRSVSVVAVPDAPQQTVLGYHQLKQGQRMDHLAYKYILDPAGYWRIAEINDVMLNDQLTEKPVITIPVK